GPLTALASGGVFAYGSGDAFPSNTFNASNYWGGVGDSQSAGSTPPQVTSVTPAAGAAGDPGSAAPSGAVCPAGGPGHEAVTAQGPGGGGVAGSVSFNAGNTVATFTPASSLAASTTYTATVSGAQNASGTPMTAPFTWTVATGAVASCPCSIWGNAAPSGAVDANDTTAVNLGVQFQPSSSGKIIGIRFYKEADNTGTHTGGLSTASGTLLASGTFT